MSLEQPVIERVPVEILEAELKENIFVRETNKGNNLIYDFDAHQAPALMQEVGRLREITFRAAGGGTGLPLDLDEFDTHPIPYRQIIVWDPEEKEILGGYRYILCDKTPLDEHGHVHLATTHMFNFSEKFVKEFLPYTIELGRSFVQPHYQSTKAGAKSLFALDNLWDGLGSLIVENPKMKYFFGKVTMYTHYNQVARDLLMAFMHKYFEDKEQLVVPFHPLKINIEEHLGGFTANNFADDYKILSKKVRDLGENIPPLINAYMSLTPSMRTFGTAINDTFGDVEETGILLTINEIHAAKADRHVRTYKP